MIQTQPTLQNSSRPITSDPTNLTKPFYSVEEFMDKLARRLGKHYGLNDIREAL